MSNASATLGAGMVPAKWRVLNALFYAGQGGINVSKLYYQQQINWDELVELDSSGRLAAMLGDVSIHLVGLTGAAHSAVAVATRVRLTSSGHRLVITNRANQVITCLGGKSNYTARVYDCRAEGMADDDLLFRMNAAGLIEPCPVSGSATSLDGFKRLPRDLRLRLTRKGRQYFPNSGAGR